MIRNLPRHLLRFSIFSALVLSVPTVASAELYSYAVLQGLNKVTARVSTINVAVGDTVTFGTIEIIARTCDKRPPEETPESAAFLDISERRDNKPAQTVFRGWMFASSPALNAMEHPVYDVWVLDCANEPVATKAEEPANGDPKSEAEADKKAE